MNITTIMRYTTTLADLPHPSTWLMTAALATSLATSALALVPAVESSDSIALMGDSITNLLKTTSR
ncbi:MAG: hypothetical protein NT154_15170 [Verrucomicrobia bacterium]|nr:hypothetical protein [Verrucomicrobiota bacterium]